MNTGKHSVAVRIKVFAQSKEEAEKIVEQVMRDGVQYRIDNSLGQAVHHWQIKK